MLVVNAILMALVGAAIVGFLVWSIRTQHRDYSGEVARVAPRPRRRLQVSVRLVTRDEPGEFLDRQSLGLEI